MAKMSLKERIAEQRKKNQAATGQFKKTYKWNSGKTRFVILNDMNGNEPWRTFGQHFIKNPRNNKILAVIGDRSIVNEEETCKVREALEDYIATIDDADEKKKYREMLAKPRHVFNALILNDPQQNPEEPVLIEMSTNQQDQVLAVYETMEEDGVDIFDEREPRILVLEKTGSGLDTEYKINAGGKNHKVPSHVLDKRIDMDEWIESLFAEGDAKALAAVKRLAGELTDESEGETSSRPALTDGRKKKTVIDDEEDAIIDDAEFEELDEDEEDDEEEEKPARKPTRKSIVEEDEEDDEEERPVRKPVKKKKPIEEELDDDDLEALLND